MVEMNDKKNCLKFLNIAKISHCLISRAVKHVVHQIGNSCEKYFRVDDSFVKYYVNFKGDIGAIKFSSIIT